ncbi:ArsR family transcriptional regulator [Desulfitispora alkaliphila]|uniref:ArsR/SmtB family transcription factor n=1 Tax=Desulfitispora alkaliphila TaxID=622674 RepID=UPI003D1F365A
MTRRKEENIEVCQEECIHQEAVNRAKRDLLERDMANSLAQTFKVLGDPNRVQMINILSKQELCVCDLAEALELSVSAVSHQLRLLRNLNLVKYRKQGKMVYYSLDDEHIKNLFMEGIEHVKHS